MVLLELANDFYKVMLNNLSLGGTFYMVHLSWMCGGDIIDDSMG